MGGDDVAWGGSISLLFGGVCWAFSQTLSRYSQRLAGVRTIDQLEDLKDIAAEAPLLVAVKGQAWSEAPLECELTKVKAVIAKVLEVQHAMRKSTTTGEWAQVDTTVRDVTREARWCLQDGSRYNLPIINGLKASNMVLEQTGAVYKARDTDLIALAQRALLDWYVLGNKVEERILPNGTMLTAVGELAVAQEQQEGSWACIGKKHDDRVLVLQEPRHVHGPFILTTRPLEDIVAEHQQWANLARTCATGLITVGIGLLLYASIREVIFILHRRRIRKQQEQETRSRAAQGHMQTPGQEAPGKQQSRVGKFRSMLRRRALQRDMQAHGQKVAAQQTPVNDKGLCSVCMEERSNMVFTGCWHMCVCQRCSQNLSRCPMCRSSSPIVRIYQA